MTRPGTGEALRWLVQFVASRKCGRCKGRKQERVGFGAYDWRTCSRCGGDGKDPDAQAALRAWDERVPLGEDGGIVQSIRTTAAQSWLSGDKSWGDVATAVAVDVDAHLFGAPARTDAIDGAKSEPTQKAPAEGTPK